MGVVQGVGQETDGKSFFKESAMEKWKREEWGAGV